MEAVEEACEQALVISRGVFDVAHEGALDLGEPKKSCVVFLWVSLTHSSRMSLECHQNFTKYLQSFRKKFALDHL